MHHLGIGLRPKFQSKVPFVDCCCNMDVIEEFKQDVVTEIFTNCTRCSVCSMCFCLVTALGIKESHGVGLLLFPLF